MTRALLAVASLLGFTAAVAQDSAARIAREESIIAKAILMEQPSKTIIGQDYQYLPGTPLIAPFLIEIPAGQKTSIHYHQVPFLAYILSGQIETDYGSKGKKVTSAGGLFVEAINWCHFGRALGSEPVRILAIYLDQSQASLARSVDCQDLQ